MNISQQWAHFGILDMTSQWSTGDFAIFNTDARLLRDVCVFLTKIYLRQNGIDKSTVDSWNAEFRQDNSQFIMGSGGSFNMDITPILSHVVIKTVDGETYHVDIGETPRELVERVKPFVYRERKVDDWIRMAKKSLSERVVSMGGAEEDEADRFVDKCIQDFIDGGGKVLEVDVRHWEGKIAGEYRLNKFKELARERGIRTVG